MRSLPRSAGLLCAGLLAASAGCVSRSTGETEVGVLVCKIGLGCAHKGVQDQLYPPGSTTLFVARIRDFYTFDTKVQNLEMVLASGRGDRNERDDLEFKTTDGNDISMDVTVAWTIDPKAADVLNAKITECWLSPDNEPPPAAAAAAAAPRAQ